MKPNFLAFSDELQKIAGLSVGAVSGPARNAGQSFMKEFWNGSKLDKALTGLGLAASVSEAVPQNDPRGQGRGRAERLLGAAGGTIGGTYGMMLGRRLRPGLMGSLVGGVAGGMMGEKLLSTPFRRPRQDAMARQAALARQQQMQQPPQPGAYPGAQDNGVPV